ncbi:endonuclease MutS2 [Planktosalinus lacus]|uniref:Endonuclease MutS2 n=1 Tax=Planktosalinus lacus TaxID=1526573 RepID=A0A8J2V9Q8_9FLAO|nr:DNA mismatch repair protein MutS [Planktosalinus lacus]GGD93429.1 endonuclease MutS2 [Planktosalinus lacus]
MIKIQTKTLQDLEFSTILEQTAQFCITDLGKEKTLKIKPFSDSEKAMQSLKEVNEFIVSLTGDNPIPNHGFDTINAELHLLSIENSILEVGGFRKILSINETTTTLLSFFEKYKQFYESLFEKSESIDIEKSISEAIKEIIDRFGEIKDNATPELAIIRRAISGMKGKINASFNTALSQAASGDYLDEIKESIIDNRRVLAVKAMHRKRIKGTALGTSKTGSIIFIEPATTLELSRELNNLLFDEKEEIKKILRQLTEFIRPYKELLNSYQNYLVEIDCIAAKAKYAQKINGILPIITKEKQLFLKNAFHPILYLSNQKKKEKTYPQTIQLKQDSRIIVISGPNAGGKSITLKTVGLLQLMLQSGFLIPVDSQSECCFFDRILTDIGDNQSIENHLSTYSYRLKMMNQFLRKCNENTLFLIDEFGTGSDPELGGALAETFLEVFYERAAFGIITTHYSNLKMLANELPCAVNANMQFNQKTLEPIYQLQIGEAGSSFTFEVAQKNGIPYSLINKAKKKIERSKVRFDKTIADLQKERAKLRKSSETLKNEEVKAKTETRQLEEINAKIQQKLESFQELYDSNQKRIHLGKKIESLAESFQNNNRKKQLIDEFLKIIAVENSKRKKEVPKVKKQEKAKEKQLEKEVEKKVAVIREKKKKEKIIQKKKEENKPKVVLKVGDRVRMTDGRAIGIIDTLEKNKAIVNYGMFTTNVSISELEFVDRKKK